MGLDAKPFAIALEQSRRLFLAPIGAGVLTLLDYDGDNGGYVERGQVRTNWFVDDESDRITNTQRLMLEISETANFTRPGTAPFGLVANLGMVAAVRYGGRTYKARLVDPAKDVQRIWRFELNATGE